MSKNFTRPAVMTILLGILCGVSAGGVFALFHDLPQIRSLETYAPPMVTRIYSADNILLAELYKEKREPVALGDIPAHLKSALLATEDKSFFNHPGVDIKGIARALLIDVTTGKFTQGASTITQQLAKTLFLTPEKKILRKIREAVLALQLERRYTKNEILTLYLNQVYFGSGAYGVESAARIFFGKSVSRLTLAECALVAGMPKAPSRYSPLVNPELSIRRRNIVLKQMAANGIISEKQHASAVAESLHLNRHPKTAVKAPWFVEYVRHQLENTVGPAMLYKGGLTVTTTLSYKMQTTGESAVEKGLLALEKRMHQNRISDPDPQGALICIDVHSGGILAMVGGRNFIKSPYNRCTARRQPGSAFKPVVYALAIEEGFSQNQKILDAPIVFKNANGGRDWEPKNYSGTYLGEIPLRKALALSKNTPAVRLIEMLGPSATTAFAHRLGINGPLAPNLSLSLGTSEVSILDLTSAYCVFADKGEQVDPYAVSEVTDRAGRRLWRPRPHRKMGMTRQGAAVISDMLKSVITEGTAGQARVLNGPYAGKTGTTDLCKDALFVGFSPDIAAGVWMGQDRHESLGPGETGARAALPVWIDFMKNSRDGSPFRYFDIPDGVVKRHMDPDTGEIVPPDTPGAVEAIFRPPDL
jgi:penicillin-binding protein 1A